MDFSRYPTPIPSEYALGEVNDPVPLHSGSFDVSTNEGSTSASGTLKWTWLPTPRIEYEIASDEATLVNAELNEELEVSLPDDAEFTRSLEESRRSNENFAFQSTGFLGNVTHGARTDISWADFLVPNMPQIYGQSLTNGKRAWRGRLDLQGGDWDVVIDSRENATSIEKKLKATGGYAATHTGRLKRSDEQLMSEEEITDALNLLRLTLTLAVGRQVAPFLITGHSESGQVAWRDLRVFPISPWSSKLPLMDGLQGDGIRELFACISKLWHDDFEKRVLNNAVNCYLRANNPNPIETAVVSGQSGLELLAHEMIVEQKREKPSGQAHINITNLLAADRIPDNILDTLTYLPNTARNADPICATGPEIITRMRNGIIHPSRRKPTYEMGEWIEAWRAIRYYLALSILARIEFTGSYKNPLKNPIWFGETERVPWAVSAS